MLHCEKHIPVNSNHEALIAFPAMIDEQIANDENRYHRNSLQKAQNNKSVAPEDFVFEQRKAVRDQ